MKTIELRYLITLFSETLQQSMVDLGGTFDLDGVAFTLIVSDDSGFCMGSTVDNMPDIKSEQGL